MPGDCLRDKGCAAQQCELHSTCCCCHILHRDVSACRICPILRHALWGLGLPFFCCVLPVFLVCCGPHVLASLCKNGKLTHEQRQGLRVIEPTVVAMCPLAIALCVVMVGSLHACTQTSKRRKETHKTKNEEEEETTQTQQQQNPTTFRPSSWNTTHSPARATKQPSKLWRGTSNKAITHNTQHTSSPAVCTPKQQHVHHFFFCLLSSSPLLFVFLLFFVFLCVRFPKQAFLHTTRSQSEVSCIPLSSAPPCSLTLTLPFRTRDPHRPHNTHTHTQNLFFFLFLFPDSCESFSLLLIAGSFVPLSLLFPSPSTQRKTKTTTTSTASNWCACVCVCVFAAAWAPFFLFFFFLLWACCFCAFFDVHTHVTLPFLFSVPPPLCSPCRAAVPTSPSTNNPSRNNSKVRACVCMSSSAVNEKQANMGTIAQFLLACIHSLKNKLSLTSSLRNTYPHSLHSLSSLTPFFTHSLHSLSSSLTLFTHSLHSLSSSLTLFTHSLHSGGRP